MVKSKHYRVFDPAEIPDLLDAARTGDLVARDELLLRFQRLISTLVHVCISGRPNLWSSYQKTFLRLFASKDVPVANVAMMLKKELTTYSKEELFSTGQLAVMIAIEKCETNLASTIVICFKDLIHKMIKDPDNAWYKNTEINEELQIASVEQDYLLDIFIDSLNPTEQAVALRIAHGEQVEADEIPESLKIKFTQYMDTSV